MCVCIIYICTYNDTYIHIHICAIFVDFVNSLKIWGMKKKVLSSFTYSHKNVILVKTC